MLDVQDESANRTTDSRMHNGVKKFKAQGIAIMYKDICTFVLLYTYVYTIY